MRVVIVAAGRFAFVVDDDAFRGVHHLEAFASGSETEIEILESVDEGFVKSTERQEEFAWYKHAGRRNGLKFTMLIDCRVSWVEISVNMVNLDLAEGYAGVLDCVVWVEQLAAHGTNAAVGEYATR